MYRALTILVLVSLSGALGCASQPLVFKNDYDARYATGPIPHYSEPRTPKAVTPKPAVTTGTVAVKPRSTWTREAPVASLMDPMGTPDRITVHHEGLPTGTLSVAETCDHIAKMRRQHMQPTSAGGLGAGDIGYHYIIDRGGIVWEGRPVQYQGAHAGGYRNVHNIGICVLGDYNQQTVPWCSQQSLSKLVRQLASRYHIPPQRIYTHRELKSTECPGRNLQAWMAQFRNDLRQGK